MAGQPARTGAAKAGSFGRKRRLRQRWQLALVHMEPARNILFIPSQQPHRAHGGCRVDKTPNPSHFNHLTPPPTDTHQQTQTKPRQPAPMRVSSDFPSVTRMGAGSRLFSLSSLCKPCRLFKLYRLSQTNFWYSLLRLLRNLCVFCVHPRIPLRPLRFLRALCVRSRIRSALTRKSRKTPTTSSHAGFKPFSFCIQHGYWLSAF